MADISPESASEGHVIAKVTPDFGDNIAAGKGAKQELAKAMPASRQALELSGFPIIEIGQNFDAKLGAGFGSGEPSVEDKAIFSNFEKLAKRTGGEPLDPVQKWQIEHMSSDQKEMFRLTMGELSNLADGKSSPADYMTKTINHAARLAEANGRKPDSWNIFKSTPGELYRDYVGLAFCDHPGGFKQDLGRGLVGSAVNPAGTALEATYKRLIAGKAGEGFNTNVTDIDSTNSVTHHYREVLMVGYNSGRFIADKATRYLDDPAQNPGDVRNGYFAAMVGAALFSGKLKPTEAAAMTNWAFIKHGGVQPPWGEGNKPGNFVDTDDYKIDDWLKAYRAAAK